MDPICNARQRTDRIAARANQHGLPAGPERRDQPGGEERGLTDARRTDDCHYRVAAQPIEKLVDVALAAHEGLMIARRVGRETGVWRGIIVLPGDPVRLGGEDMLGEPGPDLAVLALV